MIETVVVPGVTVSGKPGPFFGALYVRLIQPCAAKALQVMIAIGGVAPRHLVGDPGQRDVRLCAAKLLQCKRRNLGLSGHPCRSPQHPQRPDEIAALPNRFTRKLYRFLVVAAAEPGISGDTVINR